MKDTLEQMAAAIAVSRKLDAVDFETCKSDPWTAPPLSDPPHHAVVREAFGHVA